MNTESPTTTDRAAASVRDRILDAANRLFYDEGIQSVGMDRLVREAGVTRTTMYRQFRSKEDLVETYLRERAAHERAGSTALVESVDDPREAVRRIGVMLVEHRCAIIWRGCPFVNASAEFAPTDHVIRTISHEHRKWVMDMTERLLREAGHPQPAVASRLLMMLRTGQVIGNALDGESTDAGFLAMSDRIIDGEWDLT